MNARAFGDFMSASDVLEILKIAPVQFSITNSSQHEIRDCDAPSVHMLNCNARACVTSEYLIKLHKTCDPRQTRAF